MGTGSFPGVKRPGRGVDHPPHLAPRLKKEESCTPTPPLGIRGLLWGELYHYSLERGSASPWSGVTKDTFIKDWWLELFRPQYFQYPVIFGYDMANNAVGGPPWCSTQNLERRKCNSIHVCKKSTVCRSPLFMKLSTAERLFVMIFISDFRGQSDSKCVKYAQKFIYAPNWSVVFTTPIFTRFL